MSKSRYAIEDVMQLEAENAELKTELQSWKDSRDGIMAENEALAYSKIQTESENATLRQQVEDLQSEYKEAHTFSQIQSLASSWSYKNFGNHYGSGYRNLLGIAEEVGELCHAQLKGEQGIRHTPEEILKMKKDAVGDIIIFLCNYCDSQKLNLHDCVNVAWNVIKDRSWQSDNLTREDRNDG